MSKIAAGPDSPSRAVGKGPDFDNVRLHEMAAWRQRVRSRPSQGIDYHLLAHCWHPNWALQGLVQLCLKFVFGRRICSRALVASVGRRAAQSNCIISIDRNAAAAAAAAYRSNTRMRNRQENNNDHGQRRKRTPPKWGSIWKIINASPSDLLSPRLPNMLARPIPRTEKRRDCWKAENTSASQFVCRFSSFLASYHHLGLNHIP